MPKNSRRNFPWALLICAALLSACASTGAERSVVDDENDPFEGFNRYMFSLNERFDEYILEPAARGYDAVLPGGVKSGITNFFSNLFMPTVVVNDLLQGKFQQSGKDTTRFVINTTLGVLGLFDPASDLGFPVNDEDFGQTLGVWGVGAGPYLVLPILGPRNMRDGVGWIADQFTHPLNYSDDNAVIWGGRALDIVDTRARFLPSDKVLEQAAGDDKYLFIREAYRQRRINLIYDGNPPKEQFIADDAVAPVSADPKK